MIRLASKVGRWAWTQSVQGAVATRCVISVRCFLTILDSNRLCTKSLHLSSSLCNLCVLCVSVVHYCSEKPPQRHRAHRARTEKNCVCPLFVQSRFNRADTRDV